MTPTNPDETWSMVEIAADLGAVSTARRALVGQLRTAAVPARVVEDAALVIHELAENAVQHGGAGRGGPAGGPAGGLVEISWRLADDVVEMRVRDRGTVGFDAPVWPTRRLDGGRGLHIVEQLCRSWEVTHGPEGTEVSAHLDTRTPEVAT